MQPQVVGLVHRLWRTWFGPE